VEEVGVVGVVVVVLVGVEVADVVVGILMVVGVITLPSSHIPHKAGHSLATLACNPMTSQMGGIVEKEKHLMQCSGGYLDRKNGALLRPQAWEPI
jgi:hypothetical protein